MARARAEAGFGMIELLAAMSILVVGLLAVFAMFQSGAVQVKRASTVTTAAALADAEMEKFRAVKYDVLGMTSAALGAADSTYTGDSAYRAAGTNQVNQAVTLGASTYSPTQSAVTGADGKGYRVDTYITWHAVTSGRNLKLITIVVRDGTTPTKVWARVASSFDQSTGT